MLATAALTLGAAAAQAQVGIEIGPNGPRIYQENPYRPVERRVERRVYVEDDREECRTEIRRRINRFGERVESRVRICE